MKHYPYVTLNIVINLQIGEHVGPNGHNKLWQKDVKKSAMSLTLNLKHNLKLVLPIKMVDNIGLAHKRFTFSNIKIYLNLLKPKPSLA